MGDYCSGTNHVLPTYGYARAYSGLSVQDFTRRMTVQELTPRRPARSGPDCQHAGAAGGTGCPRRGGGPAAGGVAPGMRRVSWLTEIARPEIRALQAYEHAVWEPGLVRLHANELPWRAAATARSPASTAIPSRIRTQLTAALARFYGVGPEMLLAGRGSDELIDLLIRSYCRAGQDAVIICPPTFGMYAVAARIQGARVIEVPLQRDAGFASSRCVLGAARRSGAQAGVPVLAQQSHRQSSRRRRPSCDWRARWRGAHWWWWMRPTSNSPMQPSLTSAIGDHPGLVVLRTLSKAHGLAGARCGALLAHAEVIALLRKVIQPYAVTQLTIEAVCALARAGRAARSREPRRDAPGRTGALAAALADTRRRAQVWPSDANFLLVEFQDRAARASAVACGRPAGARCAPPPGLVEALRISVGTPEQNDRLLVSL